MGTILIGGKRYELIVDHKNGWNPAAFRERYSDVLERYDYIIGDWGYNQLRLKGFFKDNNPKANKDTYISGLVDYINEYCNFGCAYFVIQRHEAAELDPTLLNEPDLLLTPPQTAESGSEEGAVALDENGEPIVLREHIRKPHPARKEQSARADRFGGQADGKDASHRSGKQGTPRKDGRISAEDQSGGDERWGSADRRSGDQPRRGGDQPRSGGKERRGGDQPRSGGSERREGDQPRSGGSERRGGDQPRGGGKERRGGDQPRGGGSERREGDQQRSGGERRDRGGDQPRGERRGGDQQPRGGGERREGEQPREAGESPSHAEARRQTRFKQRKGQNRLPMPPREQTVAATSESALEGGSRPRGGGENEQ